MKKLIETVDETLYSSSFSRHDQADYIIPTGFLEGGLLEPGLYDRLNDWIERYYRERVHLIPPLT